MRIAGLQKLTLLDYPEHTACTVFTAGCNLRCPFCHNSELVLPERKPPLLAEEEFFSFLSKRQGILDGVCVTGGEPLLQPDIGDFLARIKALGFAVKLDTNGTRPQVLRQLVERGLVDYVAMDIKNSPDSYAKTAGIPDMDLTPIRESVDYLMSGAVDFEFRTTVADGLHTAQDMTAIGQWLQGAKRYYLQQFKDSGDILSPGLQPPSQERLEQYRQIVRQYIPSAKIRGEG